MIRMKASEYGKCMKVREYSKYKECRPEETVCRIQGLLGRIGLFPIYRWTGVSAEGIYSNRITLHPSIRGTNGKGTSQAYALASGYAELMERLENNVLLFRGGDVIGKFGFMEAPDETELFPEELMKDPDPFTRVIAGMLAKESEGSRAEDLLSMLAFTGSKGKTLRMLPYADPAKDGVTYLPIHLVRYFNGTNGMAAGNTMEEAMVQALSELIEREVNRLVMEGKVSAPAVPDEELSQYSFFPVIEKLREQSRYRVEVLDYSLGKGWPVASLTVVDLERGTFGIKFGAHPSFPIAVERTLTEAAQGSTFEEFAASCRIGTEEEVFADMNLFHVAKNGKGVYPASLFTNRPGWTFRRWTRFRGDTNRELLAEFMQLLQEEGLRVLYRDVSFLGFPACHIVIPGFHPIHAVNGRKVRLRRTEMHLAQNLKKLPELSVDDAGRLLNLIRYNEGGRIISTVAALHGLPLANPELSDGRIGLWLSIGFGEYALAEHFLDRVLADEKRKEERDILLCLMAYLRYRRSGMPSSQAAAIIRALYDAACSERVCRDVLDPGAVLERLLVPACCPECTHCFYYGNGCDYPAEEEIYKRVTEEMKKNRVSQEQLLLWLQRYQ